MSKRFDNKTILITGAASGIGLSAAQAFAAEGANIMLADINAPALASALETLRAAGACANSIVTDISKPEDCEAMVEHTLACFGRLDIAFNNAGIPSAIGGNFEDFSVADWQHQIDTNLSSVFYCMKAEVPAMKQIGAGVIVNTASVASLVAARGMAAYIASKHGVGGLTKAAALDLIEHNIRVNAVCPGMTATGMTAGVINNPQLKADIENSLPIKRIASADEVAKVVLFLASSDSSYMLGALVNVDGGVILQ